MGYLLDTSVAVHLRDDNDQALQAIAMLDSLPRISALTRAELESGIPVDPDRAALRRRGLDLFLETFGVIEFTGNTAAIYGRIVARVGFFPRKAIDRMIAATAIEHGLHLITANGADFIDIEDLKLDVWTIE